MRARIMLFLAALLPGITATAAIELNNHQARNMDDVRSLGVIYINHNFATESEANLALNEEADVRNAMYYRVILIREPVATAIYTPARIFIAIIRKTNEKAIVDLPPEQGAFFAERWLRN